jgi:hypothetical protein
VEFLHIKTTASFKRSNFKIWVRCRHCVERSSAADGGDGFLILILAENVYFAAVCARLSSGWSTNWYIPFEGTEGYYRSRHMYKTAATSPTRRHSSVRVQDSKATSQYIAGVNTVPTEVKQCELWIVNQSVQIGVRRQKVAVNRWYCEINIQRTGIWIINCYVWWHNNSSAYRSHDNIE